MNLPESSKQSIIVGLMQRMALKKTDEAAAVIALKEFHEIYGRKIAEASAFACQIYPSILTAKDLFHSVLIKVYQGAETFDPDVVRQKKEKEYLLLLEENPLAKRPEPLTDEEIFNGWIKIIAINELRGTQRGRGSSHVNNVDEETASLKDVRRYKWENSEEKNIGLHLDREPLEGSFAVNRLMLDIMALPPKRRDRIYSYLCNYPRNAPHKELTDLCKKHGTTASAIRKDRGRILTVLIMRILNRTTTEKLEKILARYTMTLDEFSQDQEQTLLLLAGKIVKDIMNPKKKRTKFEEKSYDELQGPHIMTIPRKI